MRRRFALALVLTALPFLASCSKAAGDITVSSVSPRSGSARGGDTVTLTGSGFASDSVVLFADTPAASVTLESPETLLVVTPMTYAGDADVTVQTAGKSATAPSAFTFLPLDLQFIDAPAWYLPSLASLDVTDAVAADFDGDGDEDLLVAVKNGPARLLRNSGNGSFVDEAGDVTDAGAPDAANVDDAGAAEGGAPEGGWPSAADAAADAAIASTVRTWVNDTREMLIGDLDDDGDQDVFLCNGSGQSGRILLNDGTGAFAEAPDGSFPEGSDECRHAVWSDVDGDGQRDIVIAGGGKVGSGRGYVRVYLRDGDARHPTFSALKALEPEAAIEGEKCGSVATSAPELTATSQLTRAQAAGGDTSCAVDFDATAGTGELELSFPIPALAGVPDAIELDVQAEVAGTTVRIGLTDAQGESFEYSAGSLSGAAWKHVLANNPATWPGSGSDANGVMDLPLKTLTVSFGLPDGAATGTVRVDEIRMQTPGAGTVLIDDFERVAFPISWDHAVTWVSTGDLDEDGDDDLIVASASPGSSAPVELVVNDSMPGAPVHLAVSPSAAFAALPDPISCTELLDADGDGDLDVVAISPIGQDRLMVNDGAAHFFDDTLASMPVDRSPGRFVAAVDLDRDRLPDLLIGNDGAVNRVYLQRAGRGFVDSTPSTPLRETHTIRVVPLDAEGDGDIDLFVLNRKGEDSSLYVSAAPASHDGAGR